MKFGSCSICGLPGEKTGKRELRPYGKGGALICAECGLSPERKASTMKRLGEHMDRAALAGGGAVVIGPGRAPTPYVSKPPRSKA